MKWCANRYQYVCIVCRFVRHACVWWDRKTDTDIKRRPNDSLPAHIIFVIIIYFLLLNLRKQCHTRYLFDDIFMHSLTLSKNVVENKVILHICLSIFFKSSSSSSTTYVLALCVLLWNTGGKICIQLWIKYVA